MLSVQLSIIKLVFKNPCVVKARFVPWTLYVILTIKVKMGIPESFKVGWYPLKKTGSSHLKHNIVKRILVFKR